MLNMDLQLKTWSYTLRNMKNFLYSILIGLSVSCGAKTEAALKTAATDVVDCAKAQEQTLITGLAPSVKTLLQGQLPGWDTALSTLCESCTRIDCNTRLSNK